MVKLLHKKTTKNKEPETCLSKINTTVLNYQVYYLKPKEKLLYFFLAFVVGSFIGYIFYGGIGEDEYGPTMITYICNIVVMAIAGYGCGKAVLPLRVNQILKKRKTTLRTQFISLLDSLSSSIAAGKNVQMSFVSAREDLMVQFSAESYIVQELDVILAGLKNGVQLEDLLADFGARSGMKDIENFGKVFEVSFRRGANMKDVIRNTHDILTKKILIEAEIETKITSSKNELYIMLLMPIILIGMMKFSSGDFGSYFVTPTGLISTTIAVGMFVVSFFVGQRVMKIEV